MRAELPAVSFIGTLLLVAPVAAQWKSLSIPLVATIIWLLACNLIQGIDSLVWADNFDVQSLAWCDIATNVLLGATMALPACALCSLLRLETVSSSRTLSRAFGWALSRRRQRAAFELAFCVALPLVYMALHYIVQNHRFVIYEDFGCEAAVFASPVAIMVIWVPPLLMCSAALLVTGLIFLHIYWRRLDFANHLESRSPLHLALFLRLLTAAVLHTLLLSAFFLFSLVVTAASTDFGAWTSWARVHADAGRVDVRPTAELKLDWLEHARVESAWWIIPVVSLVTVSLLADGADARKGYRECFVAAHAATGMRKPERRARGVLPIQARPIDVSFKHVSFLPGDGESDAQLKSGWDDSLRHNRFPAAKNKARTSVRAPPFALTLTPVSSIVAPPAGRARSYTVGSTASSAFVLGPGTRDDRGSEEGSVESEADASFAESTLQYLESPTGRHAHGIAHGVPLATLTAPAITVSAPITRPPSVHAQLEGQDHRQSLTPSPGFSQPRKESDGAASFGGESFLGAVAAEDWPAPPTALPAPLPALSRSPPAQSEMAHMQAPTVTRTRSGSVRTPQGGRTRAPSQRGKRGGILVAGTGAKESV